MCITGGMFIHHSIRISGLEVTCDLHNNIGDVIVHGYVMDILCMPSLHSMFTELGI